MGRSLTSTKRSSQAGGKNLPRDRAYELLKEWTGQDFGYNVATWEAWIIAKEK
jgi:hypothetical protein